MPNAGDSDATLPSLPKEDTVVAAAEAESCSGRLELLYVAVAGREVSTDAVQDIESGLAVDGAKIGLALWGPRGGKRG